MYVKMINDKQKAYQSSEVKKSLQSARIVSFIPGSRTTDLIERFGRAPFDFQQEARLVTEILDDHPTP